MSKFWCPGDFAEYYSKTIGTSSLFFVIAQTSAGADSTLVFRTTRSTSIRKNDPLLERPETRKIAGESMLCPGDVRR